MKSGGKRRSTGECGKKNKDIHCASLLHLMHYVVPVLFKTVMLGMAHRLAKVRGVVIHRSLVQNNLMENVMGKKRKVL